MYCLRDFVRLRGVLGLRESLVIKSTELRSQVWLMSLGSSLNPLNTVSLLALLESLWSSLKSFLVICQIPRVTLLVMSLL